MGVGGGGGEDRKQGVTMGLLLGSCRSLKIGSKLKLGGELTELGSG